MVMMWAKFALGLLLIALGGICNYTASRVNGGKMPVASLGIDSDRDHRIATVNDSFKILCDVIKIPTGRLFHYPYLYCSIGDVTILIGVACCAYAMIFIRQ
jgi:hypothetical protein